MELKIMTVKREDLKVGDLVLSDKGEMSYFIFGFGKTLLHNHPFIKVFYPDPLFDSPYASYLISELSSEKIVCRLAISKGGLSKRRT